MNRYVIHSFNRGFPIVVEGENKDIDRVLIKSDTYDGLTVSKLCNGQMDYLKLLNGSKLAISIKEGGKYGYEHAVAYKIGSIAGARFKKHPRQRTTIVKTKLDLLRVGNHATRKRICNEMTAGAYRSYGQSLMIYDTGDSFLFVNPNEQNNNLPQGLGRQTVRALVDAYCQNAVRIS